MTRTTHPRDKPRGPHHQHPHLEESLATTVLERLLLELTGFVVVIHPNPAGNGTPSPYLRDRLDVEKQLTELVQSQGGILFCHACHAVPSSPREAPVWMRCTHCLCRQCQTALSGPLSPRASSAPVCPLCWQLATPIRDMRDFTLTMNPP